MPTVEEYDPATDSWTRKVDMPTPRLHLASAVVDGKIYVFGGSPEWAVPLAAAEVYDPATDTWSKVADMPTERTAVWAAALNGKIYVMGGLSWESEALGTVEVYDSDTNTWANMPDMSTPPHALHRDGDGGRNLRYRRCDVRFYVSRFGRGVQALTVTQDLK